MYRKLMLATIKKSRLNYNDMLDFCCEEKLVEANECFKTINNIKFVCVNQTENFEDKRQTYNYFLIDESSAEKLIEYTNEIVYYCPTLKLFFVAINIPKSNWLFTNPSWKKE